MTLRSATRRLLERRAPMAARLFRTLREQASILRTAPKPANEGFLLVAAGGVLHHGFEEQERRIVRRELANVDIFVDVGANVGLYACLARAAGKKVIAIEPHGGNVQQLFRSLEANGWRDVEVWPLGAGSATGTISLYGAGTGASTVSGWSGASEAFHQTISITTLDILLARRFEGERLFVKIDIEGGELPALQGATTVLDRQPRPLWLVEITLGEHRTDVNPHFAETFDAFFRRGYRCTTADAEEREVTPVDVARWSAAGRVDFGSHNYLFR
ncbi:MAG: FkbM family methyltransferase [Acidobacteria bacterium]|nr:FkbM family methyltransferase [Acidobacteriota bacterium]